MSKIRRSEIIYKDINMIENNIKSALQDAYEQGKIDGYDKGRANAIDEFAELMLKHKSKDEYPIMCFDEFTIKRFVEQLKGQNNENE